MADTSAAAVPSIAGKFAANLESNAAATPPAAPVAAAPATPAVPAQQPEAATPETETPAQAAARSLAERVREELGFENVADDAEATERLIQAYRETQQQAEEANRRAEQAAELAQLRAQLAAQQQAQQPATTGASTADPYRAPQVDLALVQSMRNEDGSWKPEAPQDLKTQFQQWEAHRKRWSAQLLDTPRDALAPLVKEIFTELFSEHRQQLESESEEAAARTKFLAEADWLYAVDPRTNKPRIDPRTGQYMLSAEGVAFDGYMRRAEAVGIPSLSGQLEYAKSLRDLDLLRGQTSQSAATQQSQQINEQQKKQVLAINRAIPGQSQAGGHVAMGSQSHSPNPSLSAGQKLVALARREGVPLS